MNYVLHLMIYLCIYLVIALGFNLVMGWLGRLSLAHAGLVAIGAYGYALITLRWELEFVPAAMIVMLFGAVGSLLLSIPSWRFHGDYFVMISLAVQALLYNTVHNWYSAGAEIGSLSNFTNGPIGIPGISYPIVLGYTIESSAGICALYVILTVLVSLVLLRMTSSHWGRLLKCLRDDEVALRGLGKPAPLLKVQAFAVSGMLAALGGAMYAAYVRYIDPSIASLDECILWLSVVVVGGLGTYRGSMIGAFVILLIPEMLRFAEFPMAIAANLRYLLYGIIIVLLMHLRPQGIAGDYRMDRP